MGSALRGIRLRDCSSSWSLVIHVNVRRKDLEHADSTRAASDGVRRAIGVA